MEMETVVGPKDIEEIKIVTANFSKDLGSAVIDTVTVTCEVLSGADADASAMLVGAPTLATTSVSQRIGGGVPNVQYLIRFVATDSIGLVHVIAVEMTVGRF